MSFHDGSSACIRGRARLKPEELERRKAIALEMLRAGASRKDVIAATKLQGCQVAGVAKANGIAPQPTNKGPTPEALARRAAREAHALELLRAGRPRREVVDLAHVSAADVKRIAAENGIATLSLNRSHRRDPDRKDVTAMSYAELDALEARVAAKRLDGGARGK